MIQWIDSKQIKLSALMFNAFCGVPVCPKTTKASFNLNTKAILELSFSTFPISKEKVKSVLALNRKQFLSKTIQFINSCHQLKVLCFQHIQYNNQLVIRLNPNILKQLQRIEWSSCTELYHKKTTISVLIEHCVSLTVLHLCYTKQSAEYKHVNELMLINLIKNNKKLQIIEIIGVTVTDSLLETIFHNCKSIESLTVFTEKTHEEESQVTLQGINKFIWRTLNSNFIFVIIDGYAFSRLPLAHSKERYYFKSQTVSKKVFHDLVQLSQAPVFKQINFTDCLLYKEDEFVLWCTNTVKF
jgi:hypothetical protein